MLMVAANTPFKQVIGVELSSNSPRSLSRTCSVPSHRKRAGDIATICCDAAEFDPPAGDLVCYFYNPFDAAVVRPIADKLAARAAAGYHTIIIYFIRGTGISWTRLGVTVVYMNPRCSC